MKFLVGRVISTSMKKSCVVSVPRVIVHPKYLIKYTRHTKYMAHDEENKCFLDDIVKIQHGRRLSKRKSHSIVEIVKPAPRVERLPLSIQETLNLDLFSKSR